MFSNCFCRSFSWSTKLNGWVLKPALCYYHSCKPATSPGFHWEYSQEGYSMRETPQGLPNFSKRSQTAHCEKTHTTSSALTFHMIKIPSSKNKVKKTGRWRAVEGDWQLSFALSHALSLLSLFSVGCRKVDGGGWNSSEEKSQEAVRMWVRLRGCVITSHDMFPPLPV